MKFEFFSIPALSPEQGQQELNSFYGSHRIAAVEKQFVANGEQSYWAIYSWEKLEHNIGLFSQ